MLCNSTPPAESSVSHATSGASAADDSCQAAITLDHAYVSEMPKDRNTANDHDYATATKDVIKKRKKPRMKTADKELTRKLEDSIRNKDSEKLALRNLLPLKLVTERRDACAIARAIMGIPVLWDTLAASLSVQLGDRPKRLKNRKQGGVSVLMTKKPQDLQKFNLADVVAEFHLHFPELAAQLICIMLPKEKRKDPAAIAAIVPRLATIYSMLMFTRNFELSLLQRVSAMCLAAYRCDQKVIMFSFWLLILFWEVNYYFKDSQF